MPEQQTLPALTPSACTLVDLEVFKDAYIAEGNVSGEFTRRKLINDLYSWFKQQREATGRIVGNKPRNNQPST